MYTQAHPVFAVPFLSKYRLRDATFAVQGRFRNPAHYNEKVFATYVRDIKLVIERVIEGSLKFLFWKWPLTSTFIFMLYQLVVSYPAEFIDLLPLIVLVIMVRNYVTKPEEHILQRSLSIGEVRNLTRSPHTSPPREDSNSTSARVLSARVLSARVLSARVRDTSAHRHVPTRRTRALGIDLRVCPTCRVPQMCHVLFFNSSPPGKAFDPAADAVPEDDDDDDSDGSDDSDDEQGLMSFFDQTESTDRDADGKTKGGTDANPLVEAAPQTPQTKSEAKKQRLMRLRNPMAAAKGAVRLGMDVAMATTDIAKNVAVNSAEKAKSAASGTASYAASTMSGGLTSVTSVFKTEPLDEDLDQMRWEVEQEVYSKMPPENVGFSLNPLNPILGPIQKLLHNVLINIRIVRRIVTWDDVLLSFQ